MQVLTILSRKGGTGKSTTVFNLAASIKELKPKSRILLIDLDSQANLTLMTGSEPNAPHNAFTFLTEADTEAITHTEKYDLIGGSFELATIDTESNANIFSLKELLERISSNYDTVLIDTAAQLGAVTLESIHAADNILVTMLPDLLSLQGVIQVKDILEEMDALNKLSGFLVTKYNSRVTLQNAIIDNLNDYMKDYKLTTFKTKIRTCNALNECITSGKDIFEYKRKSNAAEDYLNLTKELKKKGVIK